MREYRLGLYEKSMPGTLTLREKLEETARAGFDYLELSIDETNEKLARLEWGEAEIEAACAAVGETGVPIGSICLSGHRKYPLGHPDACVREQSLAIMQKAVALAVRLGARIIQLAGYDVYYVDSTEETRKLFAQNLHAAVEIAAREGLVLAFETMETEFMNTVEKAMAHVNAVQSPYLQVYPDTGNITNAAHTHGSNVVEDLMTGRGHIAAVHLKESRPGVFREVPYGTGHVPFGPLATTAWQLGVRRYVGEFWYTGEKNWRELLQKNGEYLRAFLPG